MTVSTTQEMTSKERRLRRTHTKVKTGCTTCKIRRKKCDETKPHCLRCTNTGRKCDGYTFEATTTTQASQPHTTLPQRQHTTTSCPWETDLLAMHDEPLISKNFLESTERAPLSICRAPSITIFSSDGDTHCFDYFRHNTGPQLESYFGSTLWRSTAVKAAFLHPAVLKISSAIGAVHQRINHGISRRAFEYCAVADRLYHEAVCSFESFRQHEKFDSNYGDISALVFMLFALFEAFQDKPQAAIHYTKAGLRSLWNRPFIVTRSESRYCGHTRQPHLILHMYHKLRDYSTQLFGSPPRIEISTSNHSSIPACFNTLEDSRNSIFTVTGCILHSDVKIWQSAQQRRNAQTFHISRVLAWSVAHAKMFRSQTIYTATQRKSSRILKSVRDIAYLLLFIASFTDLDSIDPPVFKDFPNELDQSIAITYEHGPLFSSDLLWSRITNSTILSNKVAQVAWLVDTITDHNSPFAYTSHSFSMDSALGPPRHLTPAPETSGKVRHIIKALLDKYTPEAKDANVGLYEAIGAYSIAERLGSLEEHAVLAVAEDLVPRHLNAKWIEITCLLEDRKLLVRYCTPGEMGDQTQGLIWVQKWVEY